MFFLKGKFELLVPNETKMKGNGEISWCRLNSIYEGVQKNEKSGEGGEVLLNNE